MKLKNWSSDSIPLIHIGGKGIDLIIYQDEQAS